MDATITLATDPGAFGVALGGLEFYGGGDAQRDWAGGTYYTFDTIPAAGTALRVVVFPDDGGRAEVYGGRNPARGDYSWSMKFDGGTPLDVAVGAIAIALGKLEVR